jgi:hypothetical protein
MFRSALPSIPSHDRPEPVTSMADGRPMIVPAMPVPKAPAHRPTLASGLRDRLRAAALHLGLSATAAAAVLLTVFLGWYPQPMIQLHGVDAILFIMLAVDVVLGPLFTFIAFDRRKKHLALDLAAIVALQLAALAYGVHTIHQGRPAFVVFVKDRFEAVAPAELRPKALSEALGNPFAVRHPLRPRWVAAHMPDSAQERQAILFEAIEKGLDVQHHPKLYVDYATEASAALTRALPIERLRALNAQHGAVIDAAVVGSGLSASGLRYLPMRGPARDAAVLVDARDGRVLEVLLLQPW